MPILLGDLTDTEAREFLQQQDDIIQQVDTAGRDSEKIIKATKTMSPEHVDKVINLVGGRIQHLLVSK